MKIFIQFYFILLNFELSSDDPLLIALCHVSIKLKSDDSIILVWTGQ